MNQSRLLRLAVLALALFALLNPTDCEAQRRGRGRGPRFTPYRAFNEPARAVLEQMTLAEKVGQMTQADATQLEELAEIGELYLGSVLSGGDSDPPEGNSFEAWRDFYEACQKEALATRLAVPILYGVDAVHGHNNVLGAVIYPHNIGLGCTRDTRLVRRIGQLTALSMRATGVQWTFAPCVTVARDERWGRTYESFGEDPGIAVLLGEAAVRGLQRRDIGRPTSVLACAKHYAGDGGTTARLIIFHTQDGERHERLILDQGDTKADAETFFRLHVAPYQDAIREGVGTIMPSYSSWNGVKCSANKSLLTDLLKGRLRFEGFLISDWNAIDQIDEDYKTSIKISINAGMDMVMVPDKPRQFIQLLTELVDEGEVPMERIDDAVLRILRVKAAMGLLNDDPAVMADRDLETQFGSEEARIVARQAVRKSLVLLKNNGVLPLAKDAGRIYVAGRGADDLGMQCGGWTIRWQGESGKVTPGGTTILSAVRTAVQPAEVTYTVDGHGAEGAHAAIVVVGESPYAEGEGDDDDLALSAEDHAVIDRAKEAGVPVVVVILSGRPLILEDVVEKADAIVAAWLPGTEGNGVTDVLFGDYRPTGRLSISWPRSIDQLPINRGDEDYDPLFEYGYGLSY